MNLFLLNLCKLLRQAYTASHVSQCFKASQTNPYVLMEFSDFKVKCTAIEASQVDPQLNASQLGISARDLLPGRTTFITQVSKSNGLQASKQLLQNLGLAKTSLLMVHQDWQA